jgi:hypothetical protein
MPLQHVSAIRLLSGHGCGNWLGARCALRGLKCRDCGDRKTQVLVNPQIRQISDGTGKRLDMSCRHWVTETPFTTPLASQNDNRLLVTHVYYLMFYHFCISLSCTRTPSLWLVSRRTRPSLRWLVVPLKLEVRGVQLPSKLPHRFWRRASY